MRQSYSAQTLSISSTALESPTQNSCATHIEEYEKHYLIPSGLFHAVSKVESGRKDDTGRIVAWPWTVNSGGQGMYFPTKEEAIAAVREMQLKGIASIDVGCMQVNLYHHPKAFETLEDAFDPAKNVGYAARFLKDLKNELGSWHKAVAHYHSANPIHHIPYQRNVINTWSRDKKEGGMILAESSFDEKVSQPKINHIRRFSPKKTLSLNPPRLVSASYKGTSRRIINSINSPHIHRINKSHRKTLKIS
ncbi:MAG TPA: lytic transglycosylase domain-containing protein [Alphaproteobacteria bacterium]|nr:lytic transglycosylase domain-containing protein [Alphaproteobacteria bacterium]